MSVVYVLVGHIRTLDCLSVSDAADREGGLNHSINPRAPFTMHVFSVYIQYSHCTDYTPKALQHGKYHQGHAGRLHDRDLGRTESRKLKQETIKLTLFCFSCPCVLSTLGCVDCDACTYKSEG